MQAIGYLLALPFIHLISRLPFSLLYKVSDGIRFLVFGLLSYRREVVEINLRNSFPDKSEEELSAIQKDFEQWFCDLIVETLKTLTVGPETMKQRVSFEGTEVLEALNKKGKSCIVVMGHFGNWEYGGARYSADGSLPPLHVIYHPLRNTYFDKLMIRMRTRHGTGLYPMREAAKEMMEHKHDVRATAFIADQTPQPKRAYWMEFMKQDTPVFFGTEALSKKLDQPIVYVSITRPRRGFYHMHAEMLVKSPKSEKYGAITEKHTRRLERDIEDHPHIWLWTHKRWKHVRPADM